MVERNNVSAFGQAKIRNNIRIEQELDVGIGIWNLRKARTYVKETIIIKKERYATYFYFIFHMCNYFYHKIRRCVHFFANNVWFLLGFSVFIYSTLIPHTSNKH